MRLVIILLSSEPWTRFFVYLLQRCNEDDNFDLEADLREIEYLLNRDPSTDFSPKTDIDIIDPILERFTDEPTLVYSFPPGDNDDDLFNFKSNNEEWKKTFVW
ncbi:hypothetical protein Tco_0008050 [Tanacetum coccineum]